MRELLGGESDGDDRGGSGTLPGGGAVGGADPPAAVPAGDEPTAAAEGASARERRGGKESKERRRDKCGAFHSCHAEDDSKCYVTLPAPKFVAAQDGTKRVHRL